MANKFPPFWSDIFQIKGAALSRGNGGTPIPPQDVAQLAANWPAGNIDARTSNYLCLRPAIGGLFNPLIVSLCMICLLCIPRFPTNLILPTPPCPIALYRPFTSL